MTRQIQDSKDPNPAGLAPRDYRSSFQPVELYLASSEGSFGLKSELAAARKRFAEMGESTAVSHLEGFESIAAEIETSRFLGSSQGGTRALLAELPPLPSAQSLANQMETFSKETPNLKTDVVTLLDDRRTAPLTEKRKFDRASRTQEDLFQGQFRVLGVPQPVFKGLATAFDESSRLASEAGVSEATEKIQDNWTLTEASSVLLWGRSLQPNNEFQAVMECARVTLQIAQDATPLTAIWPRFVATERSKGMIAKPNPEGTRRINRGSSEPSELRVEIRPSVILTRRKATTGTSTEGDAGSDVGNSTLTAGPLRNEALMIRTPEGLSVHLEQHLYDGASNARAYTLFHESQRFFLFRFGAAEVRTPEVLRLFTSFQIPYAFAMVSSRAKRNEFGLWRDGFSAPQQDFLRGVSALDGISSPPEDRWTQAEPVRLYDGRNLKLPPKDAPEMDEGGIHRIDPMALANDASAVFIKPKSRINASDSEIVTPEKYPELEAICRRAF